MATDLLVIKLELFSFKVIRPSFSVPSSVLFLWKYNFSQEMLYLKKCHGVIVHREEIDRNVTWSGKKWDERMNGTGAGKGIYLQ